MTTAGSDEAETVQHVYNTHVKRLVYLNIYPGVKFFSLKPGSLVHYTVQPIGFHATCPTAYQGKSRIDKEMYKSMIPYVDPSMVRLSDQCFNNWLKKKQPKANIKLESN